ncbi:hypothetical protein, partial [Cellulomonas bogoriensis]|uniref:hypothetical protein n=1 Tax=Cellulomonas bogoriensis TaxID=301388 RepID=UPI0018DDCB98
VGGTELAALVTVRRGRRDGNRATGQGRGFDAGGDRAPDLGLLGLGLLGLGLLGLGLLGLTFLGPALPGQT